MEITVLLKGIIIGFAMAVPIGPIGIMCIRKTLAEGRVHGFIVGLGAATADMLYGCIAAFGLTIISNTIMSQKVWIRIVGGALLLFLGIRTFRAMPADPVTPVKSSGLFRSYISTVFLTLTNPLTIFSFLAIFAAVGLGTGLSYFAASALVAGIFMGSGLWFLLLSSGVMLFRKKLDLSGLRWVNKIAGILIVFSGVFAFVSLI